MRCHVQQTALLLPLLLLLLSLFVVRTQRSVENAAVFPTCAAAAAGIPPASRKPCAFLPPVLLVSSSGSSSSSSSNNRSVPPTGRTPTGIDAGHCEALGCCFSNGTDVLLGGSVPECFSVPLPQPPPGLLGNITNPNLRWFGFFGQPGSEESSYDPVAQAGFANFGCATDLATLQQGAKLGMTSFFRTQTFLIDDGSSSSSSSSSNSSSSNCSSPNNCGGGSGRRRHGAMAPSSVWSGHRLFPDWRERWAALATTLEPWVVNGTVGGLFVGDELCWGGLPFDDLVEMTAVIANTTWPGLPSSQPRPIIHYNEAKGAIVDDKDWLGRPVNYSHVPLGVDWVSFDFYNPPASYVRQWYESSLYPKMAPHQRVLLVPDASTSAHLRCVRCSALFAH